MLRDGATAVERFVASGLVFGIGLEREQLLGFAGEPQKFTRSDFEPGHFTVSAVPADRNRGRVFLIRHPKLGRWLQPGGHFEPQDRTVAEAAAREAKEETGFRLAADSAVPVALSIHRIPAWGVEPSHLHLDLQFLFELSADRSPSEAELAGRWFDLDSPESKGALEHTLRRVRTLLRS